MSLAELVPTLLALQRAEKVRAVEILRADLATDDEWGVGSGTNHYVFTPEAAAGADDVLLQLLAESAAA